jgi:acyl-CoA synthetase (AMP-forming)/AMP-acid ligase II
VVRKLPSASKEGVRAKVLDACRCTLPSYKTPGGVAFVEEMPLNSSAKVDKVRIREMIARSEIDVR